ncbi:hypothetical protein ESCOCK385M_23455 [Escherichia coli]
MRVSSNGEFEPSSWQGSGGLNDGRRCGNAGADELSVFSGEYLQVFISVELKTKT